MNENTIAAISVLFGIIIITLLINKLITHLINKARNKKIIPFKEQLQQIDAEIQRKENENKEKETLYNVKIKELQESIDFLNKKFNELKNSNTELSTKHTQLESDYKDLDKATKELQSLKNNEKTLAISIENKNSELNAINDKITSLSSIKKETDTIIHEIQSKIDLYTRIDDFVDYGLFEMPDYLYETSERFAVEIKEVREKQRELIKEGNAITLISIDKRSNNLDLSFIDKVYASQEKLILKSFNIESDFLIEKVNPSNFDRTLSRIVAIANDLEKISADLHYGLTEEYIQLKLDECTLQFQYTLLKKEELEEQRQIKEQMREEERARREYEAAIAKAEKEENLYQELLVKARKEYEDLNDTEKQKALLKIEELEKELAEAKAKAERAKSLAEQTKQGHVYVISNIGSFGENVYKIGMTRRLDPMDRVKELGDASVPFSFDVHAIIFSADAPKLENELHKQFNDKRVNAVNLRKEFFHVSLEDIRTKVDSITGETSTFTTTILADEYYQTKRLRHA